MADPIYLSVWLKDLKLHNMLQQFEALSSVFPMSSLQPGVAAVSVRAINDSEPDLLDEAFEEPLSLQDAFKHAGQFLHEDCLYEFTAYWDLWRKWEGEWRLLPQEVRISCFGPDYENELGDHLRFALGWDDQFLPDPMETRSITPVASNLRSVSRLASSMDEALSVERRLLWSSAEESFLTQLEDSVFRTQQHNGEAM